MSLETAMVPAPLTALVHTFVFGGSPSLCASNPSHNLAVQPFGASIETSADVESVVATPVSSAGEPVSTATVAVSSTTPVSSTPVLASSALEQPTSAATTRSF